MKIKHGLMCIICVLVFGLAVLGQEPTPTPPQIVVSQQFLNDANKAFELVVSLRDALLKEQAANGASAVTKAALQTQIDALNSLIAIKDRKDAAYQSLLDLRDQAFVIYERIIKTLTDMNDRLVKQLNKGQSGLDKFLGGLKKIITFVVGVAVGRQIGL